MALLWSSSTLFMTLTMYLAYDWMAAAAVLATFAAGFITKDAFTSLNISLKDDTGDNQ